jgi:putative SOS response-associated peptidase YedK
MISSLHSSSHEKLPYFSILTMDAADSVKNIHNRMPVIVPQERSGDWLSADCPYTEALRFAIKELEYRTA